MSYRVRIRILVGMSALALCAAACSSGDDTGITDLTDDENSAPDDTDQVAEEESAETTVSVDENSSDPVSADPHVAVELDTSAEIRSVDDPQICFVVGSTLLVDSLDNANRIADSLIAGGFDVVDFTDTIDEGPLRQARRLYEEGSQPIDDDFVPWVIVLADDEDEEIARQAMVFLASDPDHEADVRDNVVAPHYLNGYTMGWSMVPGEEAVPSTEAFAVDNDLEASPRPHVLVIDSGFGMRDSAGTDAFEGRVQGDPEANTDPMSPFFGHGTFVAGIIAQVNPSARITVVAVDPGENKVVWAMEAEASAAGGADTEEIEVSMPTEEAVFKEAVDSKVEVQANDDNLDKVVAINLSLGAYMCNVPVVDNGQVTGWIPSPPIGLRAAVQLLRNTYPNAATAIVAGAGNDGLNIGGTAMDVASLAILDPDQLDGVFPFYPASYPDVHAVGAVDMNLEPASWDPPLIPDVNVLGGTRGTNYGNGLLWAPGVNVISSYPGEPLVRATWSGTSFATACVTGLLSLNDPSFGGPGSITRDVSDNIRIDLSDTADETTRCWELAD